MGLGKLHKAPQVTVYYAMFLRSLCVCAACTSIINFNIINFMGTGCSQIQNYLNATNRDSKLYIDTSAEAGLDFVYKPHSQSEMLNNACRTHNIHVSQHSYTGSMYREII